MSSVRCVLDMQVEIQEVNSIDFGNRFNNNNSIHGAGRDRKVIKYRKINNKLLKTEP